MSATCPRLSVVIPARNEEAYLPACLASIEAAAAHMEGGREAVEVVVCLNRCTDATEQIARDHGAVIARDESRNLSRIRNAGAARARGDILVTIDADSVMSPNMLSLIDRKLRGGKVIGGGVLILPERVSLGIVATAAALLPLALWYRVSAGLFWCYRRDFEAIGGFNEEMVSLEDVDFALRLKAHGKGQGKRFATLLRAHIRTSCRKFDAFGDWYMLRHPRTTWSLLHGRDQQAANEYWYDVQR